MPGNDPLAVVRDINDQAPSLARHIERELTRSEIDAVRTAPETVGLRELLDHLDQLKTPAAVASNNSPAAVNAWLHRLDLHRPIHVVVGRENNHIDQMKPDPAFANAPPTFKQHAIKQWKQFVLQNISDLEDTFDKQ